MFRRYLFCVVGFVLVLAVGCVGGGSDLGGAEPMVVTPTVAADGSLPDLSIQHYTVRYDDCPWGGPGWVSVRVVNGGAAVAESFQLQINNGTVEMAGLAAEQTDEGVIMFEAGPVGGVNAAVDSTDLIAESDETNNEYQILFTPPPPCPTETAAGDMPSTPTGTPPLATPTVTPTP